MNHLPSLAISFSKESPHADTSAADRLLEKWKFLFHRFQQISSIQNIVKNGSKVAVYKYHTNKFIYKNEGVGAIADYGGLTDDVKVLEKGVFIGLQARYNKML
jgi:hypothetical protein